MFSLSFQEGMLKTILAHLKMFNFNNDVISMFLLKLTKEYI